MSDAASLGYGEILRESPTGKSWLIQLDDLGEEKWVPKDNIHEDSEVYDKEHSCGEVIVQQWWAEEEELV